MSDSEPPRRGNPEPTRRENEERDGDAYEASVPTRLSGFRGTSPTALVLAGGIALAIVLVSLITFFTRSGPTATGTRAPSTVVQEPAAPGIGGVGFQTPFIPEVTPAAGPSMTSVPLVRLPFPAPAHVAATTPEPVDVQPAQLPPQEAATVPNIVPGANSGGQSNATGDKSQMQIDQPKQSGAPGSQDAEAEADLGRVVAYQPVYRNGRVVSVVPVFRRSSPDTTNVSGAQSPSPSPSAVSTSMAGTGSGQFVSDGRGGNGSSGSTALGQDEARRYAQDSQNPNGYARNLSSHQLDTSSVINARLMSKIESDLPGTVIAQVTQPVYDSATHSTVVIPAGTRLFGGYDEETVSSSSRLLMGFNRLIFPDGEEFDIGRMPGSDSIGTAGFGGDVDRHRGTLYTSAILLTVLAAAESQVTPQTGGLYGNTSVTGQVQSAAGAELSQLGNKILNNAIDRPATIIIRPPYAFQIIVTRDLPLDEYATQHR